MKIVFSIILCIIFYFCYSFIFYLIGRLSIKRFPKFGKFMWACSDLDLRRLISVCSCDCSSCKCFNCKTLVIKDGLK